MRHVSQQTPTAEEVEEKGGGGKQLAQNQTRACSRRRRNRGTDHFCVHIVADEHLDY